MFNLTPPIPVFFDLNGHALENGYIYIGTSNLNPETNPINVYWDEAGTILAAQPLRTSNGNVVRNGIAARVYTSSDTFSITIRDKNGSLVLTTPNASSTSILQTNLASSSGSSLVGFIQGGTGAVATTMQTKARRIIDVKDFGAVGDGVTDDSAAIQNAINYAATFPRGADVVYPPGGYYVSTTLTQSTSYIRHIGSGMQVSYLITKTDIVTFNIGANPMSPMVSTDILDLGFYHNNAVAKNNPHLILVNPIQTTIRAWFQNGAYGCRQYGGQGVTYDKCYLPGNSTGGVLNSVNGLVLVAASTSGYASIAGTVELPTETDFHGIYINGPLLQGWGRGVAIYAGEHTTFTGDYYVGQSTISNIHIEQDANNKLILETKLEAGGYIDGAGTAGILITGQNGNGSQYIGSVIINCDVKGQSGTGGRGLYVDGTNRGGTIPYALYNLSINGAHFSGWITHGIEIAAGNNISLNGVKCWGNSFNALNAGDGLVIGPGVSGCTINGGHYGGAIIGAGTGNQRYGINVNSAARNVTITGADLRGNATGPLNWTADAAVNLSRIVNCPGWNEDRAAVIPAMPASTVDFYNPYGAPAQVVVFGGTVTAININGTTMFATTVNAPITVGAGDRISITYSVVPSWVWWPQ